MSSLTDNEPRTYRGTDLEELLPKIRAELGHDAIVLRQRDGLHGGIGGFFQHRCVEVVARRGAPGIDLYDEMSPAPDAAPEPPPTAIREIMRTAAPFVEHLHAAQAPLTEAEPARPQLASAPPETDPVPGAETEAAPPQAPTAGQAEPELDPEPEPPEPPQPTVTVVEPARLSGAAAAHERTLVGAGIAPALAADILGATISHAVPLAPTRAIKHLVRDALAARIPLVAAVAAGGRTIAFVGAGGAGKTLCATRLAAAYAADSDLDVRVLDLAAGELPEPPDADEPAVTIVDTPAVSPASGVEARALARRLRRLDSCDVHVVVPATLSAAAVRRLLDGLAPLKPDAIVLTHLDEVDHAGPVLDEVIARGLALSYCSDASALTPVDPAALAARVLA